MDLLDKKLAAILNEKSLSINASKIGVNLVGVYDSLFKRLVYAIQHRLFMSKQT